MAGGKKKKKPLSNPARGVATTSIASKPKTEVIENDVQLSQNNSEKPTDASQANSLPDSGSQTGVNIPTESSLTAEEFEKQLENSELQVLVEKYGQKSKRDAARQKSRLETDRRVLRGQADFLGTRKWLPAELMEEILELIKTEARSLSQGYETSSGFKQLSEEDLTVRLWTLQQSLIGAGFPEDKVFVCLQQVLEISDKISASVKDTIWGLDEALEWLARECAREELPDYDAWQRRSGALLKSQTG